MTAAGIAGRKSLQIFVFGAKAVLGHFAAVVVTVVFVEDLSVVIGIAGVLRVR